MPCAYITDLAKNIYQELGEPTSTSISFIASKLTSKPFLGQLDSLVYKCHSIENGDIVPPLDNGEISIYFLLYLADYYKKQVNAHIGAAGVKKVLTVKEGDSSVQLVNSSELAKTIRGLAKDYLDQARETADLYNRGQSTARGVSFFTIDQYGSVGNAENKYGPDFNR